MKSKTIISCFPATAFVNLSQPSQNRHISQIAHNHQHFIRHSSPSQPSVGSNPELQPPPSSFVLAVAAPLPRTDPGPKFINHLKVIGRMLKSTNWLLFILRAQPCQIYEEQHIFQNWITIPTRNNTYFKHTSNHQLDEPSTRWSPSWAARRFFSCPGRFLPGALDRPRAASPRSAPEKFTADEHHGANRLVQIQRLRMIYY